MIVALQYFLSIDVEFEWFRAFTDFDSWLSGSKSRKGQNLLFSKPNLPGQDYRDN